MRYLLHSIIVLLVHVIARIRVWRLTRRYLRVERLQRAILRRIIADAKMTQWGIEHGYMDHRYYEDFKKQVPIASYEAIAPYMERMLAGESNVLVPGVVDNFSKSSGTTNDRSKYIPMPERYLRGNTYTGGKDMVAWYIASNPKSRFFLGKSIPITGSLEIEASGAHIGDVSALIARSLPWYSQFSKTVPVNIELMKDWDAKATIIAEAAATQDVRSLVGIPTWMIEIAKRVRSQATMPDIAHAWPNFEVVFHGAVAFEPYRPIFNRLFGDKEIHFRNAYNAAEGYFAFQDTDDGEAGMRMLIDHEVFYEFIPAADYRRGDYSRVVPIWETIMGVEYAIVITASNGLCRYAIGDTVTFTSLAPHRIRITGRTKQFLNIVGEEVIADNIERALAAACEQSGCAVSAFTVAPVMPTEGTKARHDWLIEFANPPENQDIFSALLDAELKKCNSDYAAKREAMLDAPHIRFAPTGVFDAWLKDRGRYGGQSKVQVITDSEKFASLLEFAAKGHFI